MKGTPQDFMLVGLAHFMMFPRVMTGKGPILETLCEVCRDDYFGLIELTEIRREGVRGEAQEQVRASGKEVVFAAQPIQLRNRLDLNAADPRERTRAMDLMKTFLNQAKEWRARAFTLVSGPDVAGEKRQDALERLLASIKELCEVSRSRNAPPVLLELSERHSEGTPRLIGPVAEARSIATSVIGYYPRFGMALDLGHILIEGESPLEAISVLGDTLKHVHIGNCIKESPQNPAYGHQHPPFGVEGGEIGPAELAAFLRALLEAGYLTEGGGNVVTIEVRPLKGQMPSEAIDASKAALDEAWALV